MSTTMMKNIPNNSKQKALENKQGFDLAYTFWIERNIDDVSI